MSTLTKLVVVALVASFLIVAVVVGMQSMQPTPQPTPSPTPATTPTQTPTPSLSPIPTSPGLTPTSSPPTPTPSPILGEQETVRNSVMDYIKTSHPDTAQFMNNLAWTGGRVTPHDIVGAETYMYYARGWNFTMTYPVVPQPVYCIIADYKAPDVGIPYRVIWEGTWQNQIIKETDYVFAV